MKENWMLDKKNIDTLNSLILLLKHLINPPIFQNELEVKTRVNTLNDITLDGSPIKVTIFTYINLIQHRFSEFSRISALTDPHSGYFCSEFHLFQKSLELFNEKWDKNIKESYFNSLSAFDLDFNTNSIIYNPSADLYLQSLILSTDMILSQLSVLLSDEITSAQNKFKRYGKFCEGIISDNDGLYLSEYPKALSKLKEYLEIKTIMCNTEAKHGNVIDISSKIMRDNRREISIEEI